MDTIVKCTPHWLSLVPRAILCVIFLVVGIKVPASFVVALLFLISCILKKYSCSLTLDEKSLSGRTGIIKSSTLQSPIGRIDNVMINNGLFGKIFGYHTITVTCGMGTYRFKDVNNAKKLQAQFLELADKK